MKFICAYNPHLIFSIDAVPVHIKGTNRIDMLKTIERVKQMVGKEAIVQPQGLSQAA